MFVFHCTYEMFIHFVSSKIYNSVSVVCLLFIVGYSRLCFDAFTEYVLPAFRQT